MKKLILLISSIVCISFTVFSQTPEGFKYQAVIRDAGNTILSNQSIGLQITIKQGTTGGVVVYQETFQPTTNAYGLVNLEIGNGNVVNGDFTTINWANGPFFIETAIDISGGTSYAVMGTNQLMSVPYALHSKTATDVINDLVEDADANPTNEMNTSVALNGTTLEITDGNGTLSTDLSSLQDGVNDADNDPTNEIETWSTLSGIPTDFSDNVDNVDDADNDPTNEIETWFTLSGIPTDFSDNVDNVEDGDSDPTNEIETWSTLSGIPTDFSDNVDNVDDADSDSTNEIQNITLTSNILNLTLSDDSIDLSVYLDNTDGQHAEAVPYSNISSGLTATHVQDAIDELAAVGGSNWTVNGNHIHNSNAGNVGIGVSTPQGALEVYSQQASGTSALDANQTAGGWSAGNLDQYQTFTAVSSGGLTQVDLRVGSGLGAADQSGIIRIYAGSGTSGTLLATENVTFEGGGITWQSFPVTAIPQLTSGSVYSIRLTIATITTSWVGLNITNPYSEGALSINAGWDVQFRTYISPTGTAVSSLIVVNGNVGAGNITPERTLHVKDVMRLEPMTTAPDSPSAGDMYFNGTTNKLMVYDGTVWQSCW